MKWSGQNHSARRSSSPRLGSSAVDRIRARLPVLGRTHRVPRSLRMRQEDAKGYALPIRVWVEIEGAGAPFLAEFADVVILDQLWDSIYEEVQKHFGLRV